MTKSVTKIQDKDSRKRLSVVQSTEDPTKYGVVILNPDGSKIRGPKGEKGDAATISVGSTTTGEPGTCACVVNSGTCSDAILEFTIPKGDKGDKGDEGTAATVSVGSTSTLSPGCCATVSNSGTSLNAVLNFGIPKGDKGDKGDTGNAATISIGTTCTGNPGTEANVENVGTSGAAVFNFTIPQGVKGETGNAATVSVGSTSTLNPGCNACVSNSGDCHNAVLNFGIPKGEKGDTGSAATINVGTTSTLAPGCCATVSNSGTTGEAIFNFGIPKGEKGDKGDKGNTGNAATISAGTTTTLCAGCSANVTNSGTTSAAVFDFEIPKGDKGDKGDTGNAATISVGTTTTLNPGCNATVSNSGTSSAAVFNFGIPKGAKGDTGTAATISVGTTSTLAPGCSATVNNSGSSSSAVFNFGIPKGDKGDKGDTGNAATISVGTTTTLNPGCCATVSNSGSSSAAIFNFGIPKGEQGVQGEPGPTGNGICCITCEKVGKETTVTIYETDGNCCAFCVCDGNDGEGSGDVLGPSVSVNNHVVLFDGTSGKLIKDSGKTLPNVVNCLCSTSTTDALSAAQGKALNDKIEDLMALGKFLSLWNSETGQPISFPQATPYSYSTGDYYLVEVVGTTNYRPDGSSYTGTASTTVETDEVYVGDMYIYDGAIWLLQINHGKTVSFANLSGEPNDNACLCAALSSKVNSSSLCAVATSGKYCDLTGQPTKVSCFTNDCGYTTCTGTLTASNISNTAYGSSWSGVSTVAPSKNAVYNKIESVVSSIPTDNCQLANGCGYTTCTGTLVASDLNNYAKCCDIPTNNNQLTNGCGYITGISCGDVTTALGYTPYSNANPNGYTTCTGTLVASDIENLAQCCDIPSDNCQLANGCGYITSSALSSYAKCCDVPTDNCQLGNGCGYITGINCTAVTNALGYTPYNGNTNPNGYITISSVPTDNCELSNGCGYITSSALSSYAKCCDVPTDNCELANSCGYTTCTGTLTSADLNGYALSCDIPTDNCQLSNSCGFITSSSLPGNATSTVAGIVKLGSDTVQSCSMEAVSCVANRTYGVQVNSSGQMIVNVPRCNTQCVTSVNGCTGAVNLSIPTDNCQLSNGCGYTTCVGTLQDCDIACINGCCLTNGGDICIQGGISNDTCGTTTSVCKIWAGTEAEFCCLDAKNEYTIYYTF